MTALLRTFFTAFAFLFAIAVAAADPALWRLDRTDGARIYLFGTIHALRAEDAWSDDAVKKALDASDRVFVELVIDDATIATLQALSAERGFGGPGTLESAVGADLARRARALAAELGLPAQVVGGMRPWLAAQTLAAAAIGRTGADPQLGADNRVISLARGEGLAIEALDTPAVQIGVFADTSDETQKLVLESAIDQADDVETVIAAQNDAWLKGDVDALTTWLSESFDGAPEDFLDRLFAERDARWARRLDAVAAEGPSFVAVGAGHVVLENGLLDRLRAKGWRAARIDTP